MKALRTTAIALIILALLASCHTTKEIEKEQRTDTIYFTQYKVDSVDRWHTHYEYLQGDTIFVVDSFYRDRWRTLTDTAYKYRTITKTETKEVVKEVKKYVWQPFAILSVLLAAASAYLIYRLKK